MLKRLTKTLAMLAIAATTLTACAQNPADTATEQADAFKQVPDALRAEPYTAAASFAAGSGTESDPYQIGTAEELAFMADKVNSDSTDDKPFASAHYVLVSDIALNDTGDYETWTEAAPRFGWEPIGNGTDQVHEFTGTFDGAGHVVSGLYLCTESTGHNVYPALFGKANKASIKNVGIEKSLVRTFNQVGACGGLVGFAYRSQVENCIVEAELACQSGALGGTGGIVGETIKTDVLSCQYKGSATANEGAVGGIVGRFSEKSLDSCTNSGSVTSAGSATPGGIAGEIADGGNTNYTEGTFEEVPTMVTNCANNGTVACDQANSGNFAGGVCGSAYSSQSSITIDSCENSGTVRANEGTLGGIAGKAWVDEPLNAALANENPTIVISRSKNTGSVESGTPDFALSSSGGIVGSAHATKSGRCRIESCENAGDISGTNSTTGGICATALVQTSASLNIDSCMNKGELNSSTNTGSIKGGILGWLQTWTSGQAPSFSSDYLENGTLPDPLTADELASIDKANGAISITACSNETDVALDKGTFGSGGIVGMLMSPGRQESMAIEVSHCNNSGAVTANEFCYLGGIVGNIASEATCITLRSCTNDGNIDTVLDNLSKDDDEITDEQALQARRMLGGIVGVAPKLLTTIDQCANTGDIRIEGSGELVFANAKKRVATNEIAACLY
ncbi:hypothetical protein C1878_11005 [Gordonibacter sp. 28C]|uniref:hypothetical protein n=1 Tax=Gordonibacter sp. 28C TaxID=2078569 RepID=UPI000DF841AF|nr:hypothetical protein [Gordonibacter sp. 28C]RDB61546.1 hypothetical protein C1878_11005 [Gordonibacter sp. 28C]